MSENQPVLSKVEGTNNKRIAKNTVLLYCRTLLMMVISLYTSRVVLATLGVEDFGINNVVAGVVTMFAFLNSSMSTSTQRYLTYSIGKGNLEDTKMIFGNAIRIHFLIGVIVVILCETIGVWLINNKLVIPADRLVAANWVFQLALLSFFINVTQVPYNAAIIAHEKMDVYAYVSILDVVLKLLIVYFLRIIPFDKLIVYAILTFVVVQIIRTVYRVYCIKHFPECKGTYVKGNKQFREMFHFAGWNLFGSLAWMLRDQGVNMVLNVFFGPIVNAARGVAMQVSHAIHSFVGNFTTALNPQITKNYAQGKIKEMEILAYRGSRFSFLLLLFLALPLLINVDFVLGLWLKEVPQYASIFLVFIIVDQLINSLFSSPMITSMMATGNIRNYQIVVSFFILLIVPVGYLVLRQGFPPYSIFVVMNCCTLTAGLARYEFCVKQIGYARRLFLMDVILRVTSTLVLSLPLPIVIKYYNLVENPILEFFVLCAVCVVCVSIASLYVGMSAHEREMIISGLLKKLKIKKS